MNRRPLLRALGAAAFMLAGLAAGPVALAAYPDKPVKIVVGFPPGGPLDTHARLLVDQLQRHLGTTVVIDYKPGAGGTIAAHELIKAAPDGYTLLMANTGTMVINPFIYTKTAYDTLRDFTPVARTAQQPLALVTNIDFAPKTFAEFLAYAKANPGKVNYASAGNGGISHLVPEMLEDAVGIKMVHVPYKGSAPAFSDLLAGQVQFMAESIPLVSQYLKAGKVRALAMTGPVRNSAIPDVPTMAEVGVKDFEIVGFYGVLAPPKLPAEVLAKLNDAFRKTLANEDLRTRMVAQGADPAYLDSAQFGAFMKEQLVRWQAAVKKANVKLD
ncbi:MAG: tripartite tricarboxylate transporter substrate binding protein [Betaproteobacteria bacterium]|nr:tripartite tricarboxylate transporter substrate binding protein [Betaproteobacteria bacterium]